MKNFKISLTILLSVVVSSFAWSQTTPALKRHYPLDNKQPTEKVGHYNGTVHGTIQNFKDRYGNATGAVQFSDNAYISIPSLLSDFNYKQTGFTISFWVYIAESLEKQHGKTPWKDTDPIVRAFYAKKGQTPVLGFYRRGDRAVVDRYLTDINNQTKNWSVWLWDPVNFTQRTGWYQIIIAYENHRTFFYTFYPTGQIEYGLNYFGIQDIAAATSWG